MDRHGSWFLFKTGLHFCEMTMALKRFYKRKFQGHDPDTSDSIRSESMKRFHKLSEEFDFCCRSIFSQQECERKPGLQLGW